MKKLSFLIIAVIYILSFTNCTGGEDKTAADKSREQKKTASNVTDTSEYKKHLVFLNDSMYGEVQEKKETYFQLLSRFKPMPYDKFEDYHDTFIKFFKINLQGPILINFDAPFFLIYDKYKDFQKDFKVQTDIEHRPGTGDEATKFFKNRIRIYPAITPANEFYLLLMSEKLELGPTPAAYPETNKREYYNITKTGSVRVPAASTVDAERDIRKFQDVWLNTVGPQNTQYQFDSARSFTYSIEEYDELLSGAPGYWNWRPYQTSPSPREKVRVYPVIVTDDPKFPSHALFKLVFVPYNQGLGGTYTRDNTKPFFDNMDVCPDKCPANDIDLRYP